MQARFYLPMYHRFGSPDPGMDQHPDNPQSWHLYAYCLNSPTMSTDPTGMFGIRDAFNYVVNGYKAAIGYTVGVAQAPIYAGAGLAKAVAHPVETGKGLARAVSHPIATAKAIGGQIADSYNSANTAYEMGKFVGRAAGEIALLAAPFAKGGQAANLGKVGEVSEASSAVSRLNLSKALASEAQMGEVGSAMAGAGTETVFRDAGRVAATYGGDASDWAKMTSSSFKLESPTAWENLGAPKSGASFETHWIENIITKERVEFKTVLPAH